MALNAAGLIASANGWTAAYPYLSLHSSGAVTSSANETSATRVSAGWVVNGSTGVVTATNKAFTGVAANGAVVRVGYQSAATGGTYGGGSLLTGDQAANAAGQYTVDLITETPSAT